jgi:hypothetical protein
MREKKKNIRNGTEYIAGVESCFGVAVRGTMGGTWDFF